MMEPREQSTCSIPSETVGDLVVSAADCPVASWGFLDFPQCNKPQTNASAHLRKFSLTIKRRLSSQGFARVDLLPLINDYSAGISATAIMLLLSTLGRPLRVFLRHPHWRRLEADLRRPPKKSGGVGRSPLHMDFVNAENPPDLICLLCLRPDPLGGGKSLIASLDNIADELDPNHIDILSRARFSDGEIARLAGIGSDVNPFLVISRHSKWQYRFTESLLHSASDLHSLKALNAFSEILRSRVLGFMLKRGELLVLDQHRVVHARDALANGQDKVSEGERRLLLQSYIRTNPTFNKGE